MSQCDLAMSSQTGSAVRCGNDWLSLAINQEIEVYCADGHSALCFHLPCLLLDFF
jgi:hypothetical protein